MTDKQHTLISMAQTLATARHGDPLGIPEPVITKAVADVAGLFTDGHYKDADKSAAVGEIIRRTRGIDNRGAVIAQQTVVLGGAVFGPTTIVMPTRR